MKIKGPLLSTEARGTFGHVATFSKRRTGQLARYQKKQKDANSSGQQGQRAKFLNSSLACRFNEFGVCYFGTTIFGIDYDFYINKVQGKKLTWYNKCIAENIPEF